MPFTKLRILPALIILTVFLSALGINSVYAQVRPNLGNTSRLMNSGKAEMELGNYEKANNFFRQIVESNQPIPPEMPYFFAETLYQLGQYDNSSSFLKKYIQINGPKGENYEAAKELEEKLKTPLLAIANCNFCNKQGYRTQLCNTCEGEKQIAQACTFCKEKGIVGCNRCMGSGLVTTKNIFNIIEYHQCDKCTGDGRIDCPTCNGTKQEFSDCRTCQGKGELVSEELCNHEEKPRHMSMVFNRLQHGGGSIE